MGKLIWIYFEIQEEIGRYIFGKFVGIFHDVESCFKINFRRKLKIDACSHLYL